MLVGYTRSYMDLMQALRVSVNPSTYKLSRLERALRILMRWAEEPCTDKEYNYRLGVTARVFIPFKERTEKIEKERVDYETILDEIYRGKKESAPWISKAKLNSKRRKIPSKFSKAKHVHKKKVAKK